MSQCILMRERKSVMSGFSHEAENNLIEIMGNLKAEYKTDS